jgi:protein-disulfide isomerase
MIKNKAQTPQAILPGILGVILILGLLSIFSQYKINLNKNQIDKNPTNLQAKKININIEQTKGSLPPLGIATAPIKLIEFSDFQCPFCRILYFETLSKIKEEYIDKGLAVLYYRDYSFLGLESVLASLASRCANEQNKFWEYHDILFKNQKGENLGNFKEENLIKFAEELSLDLEKFKKCLDEKKYYNEIQQDIINAQTIGVRGTPFVIISNGFNSYGVEGALPYEYFKNIIDSLISEYLEKNTNNNTSINY